MAIDQCATVQWSITRRSIVGSFNKFAQNGSNRAEIESIERLQLSTTD